MYAYIDVFLLMAIGGITIFTLHITALAIIEGVVGFSIAAVCVVNGGRYVIRSFLVQVPPEQIDEIRGTVKKQSGVETDHDEVKP